MSGALQIEGFRALMLDFDINKSNRKWWYKKAMAVEGTRQKASSEKEVPIKTNAEKNTKSKK